MDAEALARRSLQADAVFCVAAGTVALVARKTAGKGLRLPVPVVVGAGGASSLWGAGLFLASTQEDWRTPTAVVAGSNVVAADGLALLALARGRGAARTATMLLAGTVGAFSLVQGYAWLQGRSEPDEAPQAAGAAS